LVTTWGNHTALTTIYGLQTLAVSDKLAQAWSSFGMIATAKPRSVACGAYDTPAQNATRRNAYTEALQKFYSEQGIFWSLFLPLLLRRHSLVPLRHRPSNIDGNLSSCLCHSGRSATSDPPDPSFNSP
jgi:hypothetical protein